MTGWGWVAVIFVGYLVVSFVTAPLIGKWLRRNSRYYPVAPLRPEVPPDLRFSCVEPAPEMEQETAASGRSDPLRPSTS